MSTKDLTDEELDQLLREVGERRGLLLPTTPEAVARSEAIPPTNDGPAWLGDPEHFRRLLREHREAENITSTVVRLRPRFEGAPRMSREDFESALAELERDGVCHGVAEPPEEDAG